MEAHNHHSRRILQPARNWIIWLSLVLALLVNFMNWGKVYLKPDFMMLVLAFWSVREPKRLGLGLPFFIGVLTDIGLGSALGQHALAYVLVCYWCVVFSRRIMMFNGIGQAFHVFPLFLIAQVLVTFIRVLAGGNFPSWIFFLASPIQALLWVPLSLVLLLPQYRPVKRDE